MRVPIASLVLAGGLLALGACGTVVPSGDLTVVEPPECRLGSVAVPTGRQTDDPRGTTRCLAKPVSQGDYYRDSNVPRPQPEPTRI